MNYRYLQSKILTIGLAGIAATTFQVAMAVPPASFNWSTVVNNGDFMPTAACAADPTKCRTFNSYNQPSVNVNQMVVIRARSRGGPGLGQPVHGVYTRDMAALGSVAKILDRNTQVPQPKNRSTVFIEPPSFPRIDIGSNMMATRGNHQPVWKVTDDEQLGTTGIYTNPFGSLITGASKLGSVDEFSFFEVPEAPGVPFDVFPGAPAVTRGATIVFKGNYTVNSFGKTGVYYRDLVNAPIPLNGTLLAPAGGTNPVVLIANTDTLIPGTTTVFGSTSPPSAAKNQTVFAGFDNEEYPTKGGIYLAPLTGTKPPLTTLVSIGTQVPGENTKTRFNRLGEGVSFDGRFVAFWGAWGTATRIVRLYCPQEGNKDRMNYCNNTGVFDSDTGSLEGDPNSVCNDTNDPNFGTSCYQEKQVPVNQGIFVYDINTRQAHVVTRTGGGFDDFVYWNFSGRAPGVAEGGEGDDGEPARWRSATFLAISGLVDGSLADATFHAAFKARAGAIDPVTHVYVNPVDGIYLRKGPGQPQILTMAETGMDGALIDPDAVDGLGKGLPITEMGLERDSFRGNSLAINASMGSEETGWAGVYLTRVPRP